MNLRNSEIKEIVIKLEFKSYIYIYICHHKTCPNNLIALNRTINLKNLFSPIFLIVSLNMILDIL